MLRLIRSGSPSGDTVTIGIVSACERSTVGRAIEAMELQIGARIEAVATVWSDVALAEATPAPNTVLLMPPRSPRLVQSVRFKILSRETAH